MGSFEDSRKKGVAKKPWIETPLIESKALSKAAGCRIFLKLENLQPSGSFKSRGVGNLVRSHALDPKNSGKRLHFFIPSAGNAGIAAVRAANDLGYPCTVAMAANIKPIMAARIREAGAEVIQEGADIEQAAQRMREGMDEMRSKPVEGTGAPIVPIELHPFDDERIWEGASSMVDEIAYQLPPPEMEEETDDGVRRPAAIAADAIICSVGGGGLMNGIIKGIERQSRMRARQGVNGGRGSDVHVVAVETRGASALAESMKANRLISLPGITSMATSLGAIRVAHRTLENAIHPPQGVRVHSLVLDDSAAARGCLRLADDQNLLVELACGVSVEAAVWRSRNSGAACANGCNGVRMDGDAEESSFGSYLSRIIPDFGPKSRVVIIVCGGSNVSVEVAAAWRKSLDDGWGADN